jgi:hypothetical protein
MRHSFLIVVVVVGILVVGPVAEGKREIPDVRGTDWSGVEKFKGKLKKVGGVTLLGNASIDIDGAGGFTYTNPVGVQFGGSVVQDRKKLVATLAPGSVATLETQIANIIVNELTLNGIDPGTTSLDIDPAKLKLKTKLKTGKNGNSISVQLKAKYTASSSTLGPGKGSFKVKGVFPQVR